MPHIPSIPDKEYPFFGSKRVAALNNGREERVGHFSEDSVFNCLFCAAVKGRRKLGYDFVEYVILKMLSEIIRGENIFKDLLSCWKEAGL